MLHDTDNTQCKAVTKSKDQLVKIFNDIPDSNDQGSATRLIKGYASIISGFAVNKNSQQIIDDHATALVFGTGPIGRASIKPDYWNSEETGPFFLRSLGCIGPANALCPPYFHRPNQGILCQPHAENNDMTPIEYLVRAVYMEFCRTREPMDANEVMKGYIEIFTELKPVGNSIIDGLSLTMVKGNNLVPLKATRLNIVHALLILFYTSHLVYSANPALHFYHPMVVITNIFLAQKNFFPPNEGMDKPLTDAHKKRYLLNLGLSIYEVLRVATDTSLFLDNAELFPVTFNPTTMPPTPKAIGYRIPSSEEAAIPSSEEAAIPSDEQAVVKTLYFLFGNQVRENTIQPDTTISAEPLDYSIIDYYMDAVDNNFDTMTKANVQTLITIVCPKDTVNLNSKKFFGIKTKEMMTTLLTKHLPAFNTAYKRYVTDVKEATDAMEDTDE
jgi:hypothetical protein